MTTVGSPVAAGPEWLRYPEDVNALVPQLWPANVARDTEGVLSHVSEQYRTGPFTKAGLRGQLQTMFALYDTLTVRVRIDTVRMLGDQAWVYSTGDVNGRLQWVGRWVPVLSWQRELEVARRENGVWRLIGYQQ